MIYLILGIASFEQNCVILKGLFQSNLLKQHMFTIVIDQSLSNFAMYEYRCLDNIKKLYTPADKCDDQIQFKLILEASMVSTPDIFTNDSPMSPGPPMIVKKCSAIKPLRLFTEVLVFKQNCCPPVKCF